MADLRNQAKEKRGKMRHVFADTDVPAHRFLMQMFNVDEPNMHLRVTLQDEDANDFYHYLEWYDRWTDGFQELKKELGAIREQQQEEGNKDEL
jgi:hypothetical protein